ncbi:MAG: hypothetical protein ACR2LQ_03535 [Acidimicrobiales bacterium]
MGATAQGAEAGRPDAGDQALAPSSRLKGVAAVGHEAIGEVPGGFHGLTMRL